MRNKSLLVGIFQWIKPEEIDYPKFLLDLKDHKDPVRTKVAQVDPDHVFQRKTVRGQRPFTVKKQFDL